MIDNAGIVVFYLCYIGILVITLLFLARRTRIREDLPQRWIYLAFVALTSGDSVHILSRVVVYFAGIVGENLEMIYAQDWAISVLGIGLAASSVTMHLFYVLIYVYWRKCELRRWTKTRDGENRAPPRHVPVLDVVAFFMFISRVLLVFLPENQWGVSSTVPNVTRYVTNLPFYVMGVLTITLLFLQSKVTGQESMPGCSPRERKMARDLACWMVFSFAMYSLTVFLTWVSPLFGMAMLPKTLAYLAMLYSFLKGYILKSK